VVNAKHVVYANNLFASPPLVLTPTTLFLPTLALFATPIRMRPATAAKPHVAKQGVITTRA
jgi:hypothetical protein